MKILVVDDSVTMRRIIIKNLKSAGFDDFVEASNGSEAIISMKGVELVILDWVMPVMDGKTFMKEIRQSPVFRDVPVIMVTKDGAKKEIIEGIKHGVNDFIIKPFQPEILIDKVVNIQNAK